MLKKVSTDCQRQLTGICDDSYNARNGVVSAAESSEVEGETEKLVDKNITKQITEFLNQFCLCRSIY